MARSRVVGDQKLAVPKTKAWARQRIVITKQSTYQEKEGKVGGANLKEASWAVGAVSLQAEVLSLFSTVGKMYGESLAHGLSMPRG